MVAQKVSRNTRIQIGTALVIPLLIAGLMYFDPPVSQKMKRIGEAMLSLDRHVVP